MLRYIQEAVKLNQADGSPQEPKSRKKLKIPDYLTAAIEEE